jgi:quercetin dioxygenase-like cupin family protein
MSIVFPDPIASLPKADVPIEGVRAYLSQGEGHQIIFMEFARDVEVGEHSHESQWAVVLDGRIDITIDGELRKLGRGDQYYIPRGVKHSAKVYEGYADVTFFNQADRYRRK